MFAALQTATEHRRTNLSIAPVACRSPRKPVTSVFVASLQTATEFRRTSNSFCAFYRGLAALAGLAPLVQNLCSLRSRPLWSFVESIYQMLLILAARHASR